MCCGHSAFCYHGVKGHLVVEDGEKQPKGESEHEFDESSALTGREFEVGAGGVHAGALQGRKAGVRGGPCPPCGRGNPMPTPTGSPPVLLTATSTRTRTHTHTRPLAPRLPTGTDSTTTPTLAPTTSPTSLPPPATTIHHTCRINKHPTRPLPTQSLPTTLLYPLRPTKLLTNQPNSTATTRVRTSVVGSLRCTV